MCYDSTLKHLCKGSVWNFLGEGVVSWGTVQGEVIWCILFMLLYHPSLQTVSFLSLQYYWLKYRCNECQTYDYKQMYGLSTTSTRISVSRGKRWTVMLRVHTRSGDGEWAKTTVDACSLVVMRPVRDLEARLDAHNRTLVSHLTWKAPHDIRNLQVKKKKHQHQQLKMKNLVINVNWICIR